jgi:hypothetical protein
MARGRNLKGRIRTGSLLSAIPSSRPLLKSTDYGEKVLIQSREIGVVGDRWIESFLEANRHLLKRLDVRPEVRVDPLPRVFLYPGARVGAIPLLSPSTRKAVAGLLIEPRMRWSALGDVFSGIGFSVEPFLGGAPLVPGSAREVPPWLLASPVIKRIAGMLKYRRRGFIVREEYKQSPRGRVDWLKWGQKDVPHGHWAEFPCRYSDPDDDPVIMAAIRWTLNRLGEELSTMEWSPPARMLIKRTVELQMMIGPGIARRPSPSWAPVAASEWVSLAVEAMNWVAEERGLGGSRTLDGLAWDLSIDAVWEAWVSAFASDLSRILGLVASPYGNVRRFLHWRGAFESMGSLAPDVELRGNSRTIWIDAKYKMHFDMMKRRGWKGISEEIREMHRADIHQALAYGAIGESEQVDTILVYPEIGDEKGGAFTQTWLVTGRRRLRLILASLPFGFKSEEHKKLVVNNWQKGLAA